MEILSSPQSMVPLNAKFGFHYPFFATLAHQEDMDNPAFSQNQLIRIDIAKEVELLAHQEANFEITIPTLSFTDPSFEYDIRPSFATPFALNGHMATQHDLSSSRAKEVWVTDIMGNRYELQFNEKGVIDYAETLKALPEGLNVFTTIQSVTYVYSQSQLIDGAGLEKVSQFDGQLILLAPVHIPKKFVLDMSVKNDAGQVLHHHNVAYTPTALESVLDVAEMRLDWQGQQAQGVLSIDVAARANAMQNAFRYDFKLELPEIDQGMIRLHGSQEVIAEPGQSHVLHQYHGLSTKALSEIFQSMLPLRSEKTGHGFHQNLSAQENTGSQFNQFDRVDGAIEALYSQVIQGLTDSAIPIAAIRDYVSSDFVDDIFNFDTSHWDRHDSTVFSMMMDELSNFGAETPSELSEQFVDIVDRYIALESKYPHASLILETTDIVIDEDFSVFAQITPQHADYHLPITVGQATLDDYHFETLNDYTNQANPFAQNDDFIADLNIEVEEFEHIQVQHHVFKVSDASIMHGADIIEGFSFENQDRLDLTQLLENLSVEPTAAEVHLKTNEQGDAEVFLTVPTEIEPQDIHVATLKGVNAAGGDLPPDLSNFIDLI